LGAAALFLRCAKAAGAERETTSRIVNSRLILNFEISFLAVREKMAEAHAET